ncbi:MAG: hypothetical protein UV85_C0012G0003 [Candidatus Nomurabacteria bacterium GW2011_GWB1_43_19]|nr:MAG: hypothetical protein UV85_C0012G0003 [Candidatus Nomurabacteria bacterium GW2011_GWB1_43_19]
MSFFKNNEGIKTAELKLGDFDQIWTKFCFLDESGSLSNRTDPYFTIGILKMSMPYYLQSKILYERSRRAKFIIDSLFEVRSIYFYSYTTHKMSRYFQRNFS